MHNFDTIGFKSATRPDVRIRVVWKTISALQEKFNLSGTEARSLLGGMSDLEVARGQQMLDVDVFENVIARVSLLLGIYKGLRILLDEEPQAVTWIDRPNSLTPFNSACPRSLMASGDIEALASVRQFVDHWTT